MDLCLGLPCVHSSISINDSCHDVATKLYCVHIGSDIISICTTS